MLPWAFNPQLVVEEVLNVVRILMVVAGAAMAFLLLVSLMFADPVWRHLKSYSINFGRKRERSVATAVPEGVSPSRTAPR